MQRMPFASRPPGKSARKSPRRKTAETESGAWIGSFQPASREAGPWHSRRAGRGSANFFRQTRLEAAPRTILFTDEAFYASQSVAAVLYCRRGEGDGYNLQYLRRN